MQEQFFGKIFWLSFLGILGSVVLGFLALGNPFASVLTILSLVVAFALTIKRVEYGLLFAFAELFSTSHGHLFSMEIHGFVLSVRMAIFVGVMSAWMLAALQKKIHVQKNWDLRPWSLLFLAVVIGCITGGNTNPALDVFKDGNAYGYLLYLLPVMSVTWTNNERRSLLQVLCGSAAAVTTITLALLYTYTHLPEPVLRAVYTFVRDTRLAELTRIAGDIFRIFLQAQFSLLAMLFLFSAAIVFLWKSTREREVIFYALVFCLSVLIISLSRSFWIGMLAGGLVWLGIVFSQRMWSLRQAWNFLPTKLVIFLTSLSVLWIVIAFPVPPPANISVFGDILRDRTTEMDDSAISSRWNLLPEMMTVIYEHPLIGSGFGTKVAFKSDDPRVRAVYPDGKWRTYSFEWGWLDAWLKMGLLGPIALLWVGLSLAKGLIRNLKKENGWISLGLLCTLVALYVIHILSPYLNHPIGIGFLLFLLPFVTTARAPKKENAIYPSPSIAPYPRLNSS